MPYGPFISSFVGRRDELEQVRRLLDENRLVTLYGVGGLGKTRLAYRACAALHPDFDQVWAVDLADVADGALLASAVAAVVGVPAPATELDVSSFVDAIGEQTALLYLDNCEHMLEACAAFIAAVLRAAPGLRVLTTSRQALGIAGECVYSVPELSASDAIELFGERASSASGAWNLSRDNREDVADLCQALEGVPLAIELAAVQIRAFSPRTMITRFAESAAILSQSVRGNPDRHRSLEACIGWSYELCTPEERTLWARLSVFVGDFSLEAAEEVCSGADLDREAVGDALVRLCEKSLLRRDLDDSATRYRMLEVIRQFGWARLVEADDLLEWRRRHRDYYLRLAENFDAEWIGPRQLKLIGACHREQSNIRAAMDFGANNPDEAPLAMRMCAVLEHFFTTTGAGAEALHFIELSLAHGTGTDVERASALRVGAFIAVLTDQLDVAAAMCADMRELCDRADQSERDLVVAYTLFAESFLQTWRGDPDAGAASAGAAIELFDKVGDLARGVNLKFCRGMMLSWAERRAEAADQYARFFEVAAPLGERHHSSYARWAVGLDTLLEGHVDEAIALERQALRDRLEFGDLLCIGLILEVLAWAGVAQRKGQHAALLTGAADAIWGLIGMPIAAMPFLSKQREEGKYATQKLLSPAEFDAVLEAGRAMALPEVVAIALGEAIYAAPASNSRLTQRELEIAQMVAGGATNKAIADELVISVRTVESHVEQVLRKLDVPSRAGVAGALAGQATVPSLRSVKA